MTLAALHVAYDGRARAPSHRLVLRIEAVTGISRHILRPDIYGPEPNTTREQPKRKAA